MTITSRGPAMITYLVNLFTTAATLGAAAAPNTVTIFDGPVTTELDPPLALFVGLADPDATTGQNAYDSSQAWASLGRLARNESLTIHCCAQAWSGADDVKTVRDACNGITAAVETLMQSDTTSFGGNVLFPDPGMTNVAAPQNNDTGKGVIVRQSFDLAFMCRIGG